MYNFGSWMQPKHILEDYTDPQELYDDQTTLMPVGTGAFVLTEFVPGQYWVMEANENWFGGKWQNPNGRPYLDKLVYKVYKDPTSAVLALLTGEVDYLNERLGASIEVEQLELLQENPDYKVVGTPYSNNMAMCFNNRTEAIDKHPWLADKNVRLAIAHAIDKDSIVENVLGGLTTTAWRAI